MSVPWSESLRRSLCATLPRANRSIEAADRRHVLFVAPRCATAVARDREGRAVRTGCVDFFLAGATAACDDSSGAAAASDFVVGAFAASDCVG